MKEKVSGQHEKWRASYCVCRVCGHEFVYVYPDGTEDEDHIECAKCHERSAEVPYLDEVREEVREAFLMGQAAAMVNALFEGKGGPGHVSE
jgi:transposase